MWRAHCPKHQDFCAAVFRANSGCLSASRSSKVVWYKKKWVYNSPGLCSGLWLITSILFCPWASPLPYSYKLWCSTSPHPRPSTHIWVRAMQQESCPQDQQRDSCNLLLTSCLTLHLWPESSGRHLPPSVAPKACCWFAAWPTLDFTPLSPWYNTPDWVVLGWRIVLPILLWLLLVCICFEALYDKVAWRGNWESSGEALPFLCNPKWDPKGIRTSCQL